MEPHVRVPRQYGPAGLEVHARQHQRGPWWSAGRRGPRGFGREQDETAVRVHLAPGRRGRTLDRKSTRLNSSHSQISYAVFCLKKKKKQYERERKRTILNSSHSQIEYHVFCFTKTQIGTLDHLSSERDRASHNCRRHSVRCSLE